MSNKVNKYFLINKVEQSQLDIYRNKDNMTQDLLVLALQYKVCPVGY